MQNKLFLFYFVKNVKDIAYNCYNVIVMLFVLLFVNH
jgi:hypothetical protein